LRNFLTGFSGFSGFTGGEGGAGGRCFAAATSEAAKLAIRGFTLKTVFPISPDRSFHQGGTGLFG
jgi:hypothetical protein